MAIIGNIPYFQTNPYVAYHDDDVYDDCDDYPRVHPVMTTWVCLKIGYPDVPPNQPKSINIIVYHYFPHQKKCLWFLLSPCLKWHTFRTPTTFQQGLDPGGASGFEILEFAPDGTPAKQWGYSGCEGARVGQGKLRFRDWWIHRVENRVLPAQKMEQLPRLCM